MDIGLMGCRCLRSYQRVLEAIVDNEEGGCGRHRSEECRWKACVHAPQHAAKGVSRKNFGMLAAEVGLEPSLDGVERK